MSRFKPGDDVWVDFSGNEWPGEVLKVESGYVLCRIQIDPEWDFGSASARVDPEPTVAARVGKIRVRSGGVV